MKIYAASSRRNQSFGQVVDALRGAGHEVHDFRDDDFTWDEVQDAHGYFTKLAHPVPWRKFEDLRAAIIAADAAVLVLPCGRDAHAEFGYAAGIGKPTVVMTGSDRNNPEPDLAHLLAYAIVDTIDELVAALDYMDVLTAA